jgi:hypothetical protein
MPFSSLTKACRPVVVSILLSHHNRAETFCGPADFLTAGPRGSPLAFFYLRIATNFVRMISLGCGNGLWQVAPSFYATFVVEG